MSGSQPAAVPWEGFLQLMLSTEDPRGVLPELLGVSPQTTSLKGVHVMNDVAQSVLGGCPVGAGDLLCCVIRHQHTGPSEDNSDTALRFHERYGEPYSRAYPANLGAGQTLRLRRAAELLLNADGGMYKPRTRMASGLGTHLQLLGQEGFRRFGVGHLVGAIIGAEGRDVVRGLFEDPRDPVARALRPLFQGQEVVDTHPEVPRIPLSSFDRTLGRRLTALLQQPLSKPVLLRLFVQATSLGLFLKVHGAGKPTGRPLVLGLSPAKRKKPAVLRQCSAATLRRGVEALDRELGARVTAHPSLPELLRTRPTRGAPTLPVDHARLVADPGVALVGAARQQRTPKGVTSLTWPEEWVYALGRRTGFLPPGGGRAQYLRMTPELVEALVLMFVADGVTLAWEDLWRCIRQELGLIIGADTFLDRRALSDAGVPPASAASLSSNNDEVLLAGCIRGVARHLPDSGAEAGGICGDLP